MATGDWDAVVVAHSSFKKIDMPRDMQEEILQEQIDAVITAIEESKQNDGGRATIKQLEKQREKMETRYEKLMAGTGAKDRAVDFADLGVDALFVDESHEFKNLSYTTTMNVSASATLRGQPRRWICSSSAGICKKARGPGRVLHDRNAHQQYHCRSLYAATLFAV